MRRKSTRTKKMPKRGQIMIIMMSSGRTRKRRTTKRRKARSRR